MILQRRFKSKILILFIFIIFILVIIDLLSYESISLVRPFANRVKKIYLNLEYILSNNKKKPLVVKVIHHGAPFDAMIDPYKQDKVFARIINNSMIIDVLNEKYNLIFDSYNKNYDIVIDGVFGNKLNNDNYIEDLRLNENPRAVKLIYIMEAFTPDIDKYDLSIGFDFIDDPKYLRIPLYYMYFKNSVNSEYNRGECTPYKSKFACFLVSRNDSINTFNGLPFDGCIARNRMFFLLSLYKLVESGGRYLNNIGGPIAHDNTMSYDQEANKFLSDCKFVIAYENQSWNGYITEKPFQAYLAGAIPIYYADKSVLADINHNAVIFAPDFSDENALVEYIKKVDNDDELYCKIWNQQLLKSSDSNYEVVKARLREKLFKIIKDKLGK